MGEPLLRGSPCACRRGRGLRAVRGLQHVLQLADDEIRPVEVDMAAALLRRLLAASTDGRSPLRCPLLQWWRHGKTAFRVMHRTMCFSLRSDSVLTLMHTGTYTGSMCFHVWSEGARRPVCFPIIVLISNAEGRHVGVEDE